MKWFDLFLFKNPIGFLSALVIGIFMCIYANRKSRMICASIFLALSVFSITVPIAGNSPDYLILPILCVPFFITISIVFLIYESAKILIKVLKNTTKTR